MLVPIVQKLIEHRRQQTAGLGARAYHHSDYELLRSFHTVSLNAGRAAGHTRAIVQMFNQDASDVVVVANEMWKNELSDMGIPKTFIYVEKIARMLRPDSPRILDKDSTVFVDTTSWWCKEEKLARLYDGVIGEVGYVYGDERKANYPIICLLS